MLRARKRSTATNTNASATRDGKETDKLARIARRMIPVRQNGRNGRSGRVVRRNAAEDSKLAIAFATLAARTIQNAWAMNHKLNDATNNLVVSTTMNFKNNYLKIT